MKQSPVKFLVMCNLAIIIFLSIGNIFAQEKTDQASPKKGRISCLRELESRLITGVEKDFFMALEKREAEYLDLVDALDLLLYSDTKAVCEMTKISDYDAYLDVLQTERTKLFWNTTILIPDDSFRVLFFQETPNTRIRPGISCLIVITDINYQIRNWIRSVCQDYFINASLKKGEDGFIFTITSKAYFEEKDLRFSRYKITANEIKRIQPDN